MTGDGCQDHDLRRRPLPDTKGEYVAGRCWARQQPRARMSSTHPKRTALRFLAFSASRPRSPGGAEVTIASSKFWVAPATAATAWSKAALLAADGLVAPLTFRTYCRAAKCTSCAVAGGA